MIRFTPEFKENLFMSTQLCARPHTVLFFVFAFGIVFQQPAIGDDAWGSIKGRIIYSGDAFEPAKITVERDPAVCGVGGQVDESLVVSPKNRGIRNIAIWLETRAAIPVHPDFKEPPAKAPVLDNRNCRFEPHMLAVRTGQVLELTNSDPVAHNAAVYARRNMPFSEIIPMNQPLQKKFAKFEALPVRVDCSIHPWMKAWLIVSDHPYVAVTGEDGSFEIQNIPVGEWKFRFWHERPGYIQSLVSDDKPVPLEKGNWVMNITADKTLDFGDLIAPAEQFATTKK